MACLKPRRRKSAGGYAGTLKYAYSILSETQPSPPDLHLVAYSPRKMLLMTGIGTPVLSSRQR